MRCPTCNRRVPGGQDTCTACGAFVSNAYLGRAGGGLVIPPDIRKPPDVSKPTDVRKPALERPQYGFPSESAEPDVEEIRDVLEQEESPPPPQPGQPETPPPPKYAGLLRILFPLIFILIPLVNLLVRNSPFGADERPVLQETQFFESVSAGEFSNPKTSFSRSQDERVVVFARWTGARGGHEYSFRWLTPEGNALPDTSSVTRFQFGSGEEEFSAYALLPLRDELPLGEWRVEVTVDGDVVAQPAFQLLE